MPHTYPIMLDVADRVVVIIGGGAVAKRKAVGLLAAGANRVRAVATQFDADFPQVWQRIEAPFDPAHLADAKIVFIATDSAEVNDHAAACAHHIGVLVNRADQAEGEYGDFTVPAILRRGLVTVAVSAGGAPSLAAALRDVIAGAIPQEVIELNTAVLDLRQRLRAADFAPADRQRILRLATSLDLLSAFRHGGKIEWWNRLVQVEAKLSVLDIGHRD